MHLCLNMIVKNESNTIKRLIDSLIGIIDSYVIMDTGSTDDTIDVIRNNIKVSGSIVEEPFVNFSHSRNSALIKANELCPIATHFLLLDSDMKLIVTDIIEFRKIIESNDLLFLFQGNETFYYQNVRIVKSNKFNESYYVGATHEYINFPPYYITKIIDKDLAFIHDIGDGGSKTNKYERDINLLLQDIHNEPNNPRSYFYLGNSYADNGQPNEAIESWKKRVSLGGWNQEVWYSLYRMGETYMKTGQSEKAINSWLEAVNVCPLRIENIYEIIKHYRVDGKHVLAYMFYTIAKKSMSLLTEQAKNDFLFLHNDIYTYKLDYEFSILAYYLQDSHIKDIDLMYVHLFNVCNDDKLIQNMFSNIKFYVNIPIPIKSYNLSSSFVHNGKLMRSSSCSFIDDLINIRFVNYYINETGQYLDCSDQICTINKSFNFSSSFELKEVNTYYPTETDRLYAGIEDLRLFVKEDQIMFLGTSYHINNKLGIVYGNYGNTINGIELEPSGFDVVSSQCEKNWVATGDGTEIIYKWNPLQVGFVVSNKCIHIRQVQTPNIFKYARGSSNGFIYNDECWYIVHFVSYECPRYYYHMLVVFDKLTTNLLRYTSLFKLSSSPIEYAIGLQIVNDKIIIGYSVWDRETHISEYNIDSFRYVSIR